MGPWFKLRGLGRAALGTVCLAALGSECRRAPTPEPEPPRHTLAISPHPRSVLAERERVVVEGRWFPIGATPESQVLLPAARFECRRSAGSCVEQLTRLPQGGGAEPSHEVFEYRIEEWTPWGRRAGKLVAARRDGSARVEIRVSLRGRTALKVAIANGTEKCWRID